MILIGLGANLPTPGYATPQLTLAAALRQIDGEGLRVTRCSRWYRSAPVPLSDQPWFVNAVAELEGDSPPEALMARLHDIEAGFGRLRRVVNAARPIDLDLLDYHGRVSAPGVQPVLPHPRIAGRAFVLLPLAELAPDWRHPTTGQGIEALVAALPKDQDIEVMEDP